MGPDSGPWPWLAGLFATGFFALAAIIATAQYREKKNTNGHSKQRWSEVADLIDARLISLEKERDLWRDRWHGPPGHQELGISGTMLKVVYLIDDLKELRGRVKDLEEE